MFEQQQIEFGTIYVVGMVTVNPFLAELSEVQGLLLPIEVAPRGAELLGESRLVHFVDQTELAEDPHGGEDQRLAHMRAGMVMAF
jgi:hypothetical protein